MTPIVSLFHSDSKISAHKGPTAPAAAAYSFVALFLFESVLHNESCIILHDCTVTGAIEIVCSESMSKEINPWAEPL